MNKDIKQTANVNPGPSKEIFVYYYKELWTNNSIQENYWNNDTDDKIVTMEELKEALKKSPGKDNLNSELHKYAGAHFMRDYWIFKWHSYNGRNALRVGKQYSCTYIKDR
jgi:hypothetical protein